VIDAARLVAAVRVFAAAWLVLVVAAVPAQAATGATHPASEWAEIRAVVTAQREALVAGDGERAFGYASPALRRRYRTAQAFMRMADEGYRPLVAARYVEFLEGAIVEGSTIQPLRLVMPDGTVLVALYEMEEQRGGSWRIAGCVIAPSTLKAA
jgi:hypothetical protein